MFRILLCLGALTILVSSDDVCPGSEVPCAGTCTERLSSTMTHAQAANACKVRGKRTYMGSRTNAQLESSCSRVVGSQDTQYIWTRYKLRGGLIVDEVGATIDRMNWGIQYCGGVNQLGQFIAHPCSWDKYAVCVTNTEQYDKDHIQRCQNEFYWVTDRSGLNYESAVNYCRSNNMKLVTPYTTARKSCLSSLMQSKNYEAWIDYNITAATQSIEPWDKDYCIKVNIGNSYKVDRCSTKLPVTCASFGELVISNDVVQKGDPASVSCRCYNCTVDEIQWTDGTTTYRSNDVMGDVSVTAIPDSTGVYSVLTLARTALDQVYTCIQTTPFTASVIYKTAKMDVYDLEVSSHYIKYGARITLTCNFNNDKSLDMKRVEWLDLRDGNNMTGRSRTQYRGNSVISTVEINSEYYTHDVRCTFYAHGAGYPYNGNVRIIVYKIVGSNSAVPANANTTLTCDLKEHEDQGHSVLLVAPTRVDWLKGATSTRIPSEVVSKFKAVLHRNMRTGVDLYTCRFLFGNGDLLSKTLTVTAFTFDGVPANVANGTTGSLKCSYSDGDQPQEPLWWERQGVRINDGKKYKGETYRINSNYMNESSTYKAWTTASIHNATYSAAYQCCLKVTGKVWRKTIFLNVYPGEFISRNVTILETVDERTGEIVVSCSVWAYPRPNIQLFIDTVPENGVSSALNNVTTLTVRIDRTCDAAQFKCLASNNKGTREKAMQSKLHKRCGFFAKLSLMMWGIIGGVLLFLIVLIIVICCCFCRRTKKLKEEVEYHREVLSTVDNQSMGQSLYSTNIARAKVKGQQYEDMYDEGNSNMYDPIGKGRYQELLDRDVAMYSEPYSEIGSARGMMSPKYERIGAGSEYEPNANAPLFMSRSKSRENMTRSRENMFSPVLMKKSVASLSYQNLKDQSARSGYPSMASIQKSNMSRSATNIPNMRKFSQPVDDRSDHIKMNPFGNVQRLKSDDAEYEVASITSRIPPSEVSDMTPPVAILSPRGWEIPSEPARMFSPPAARRPRQDRKFSEPSTSSAWQEAQDKVNNWNLPPTAEEMDRRSEMSEASTFKKPAKSGWSTPSRLMSSAGESTDQSSSILDSISITPMYPPGARPTDQHQTFSPIPGQHPHDRVAYCSSPPPTSAVFENDKQKQNLENNVFDIDDLSSVDVPDTCGMDTLDRRVFAAENFYTPPRGAVEAPTRTTSLAPARGSPRPANGAPRPNPRGPPQGVKVLPSVPKSRDNLRTSHF